MRIPLDRCRDDHSCRQCLEEFEGEEERRSHWCGMDRGGRRCPLGCGGQGGGTEAELRRHLTALHGMDPSEVTVEEGAVITQSSEFW